MNLCSSFYPLHIALCQLSTLGFPCFFKAQNVFHHRERKIPYVTMPQFTRDSYFTQRWKKDSANI